jgi:ketosteroid isomerase-like protein
MSQENVELIRRSVSHFNETGVPAWDLMDSEITFTTRGEIEARRTYTGPHGVEKAMSNFRKVWDTISWDVQEIIGTDDTFVVAFLIHLRGAGSGVAVDVEEAWALWIRDGKFVRIEQYGTKREALEAAGLSE